MKGKLVVILIILSLIVGFVAIVNLPRYSSVPIHAYDGLESRFSAITYHDQPQSYVTLNQSSAYIDPPLGVGGPDDPWRLANPTGIIGELSQPQPQLDRKIERAPIYENETLDDGSVHMKKWAAYEVPVTFTVEIRTGGSGVNPITEVKFRVRLTENTFSVFSGTTTAYSYVLWVRTTDVEIIRYGHTLEMIPLTTGFSFNLYPAGGSEELPLPPDETKVYDWENLKLFRSVEIEFYMLNMKPAWDFLSNMRQDAQVWFELEARVLLIGHWDVTIPPHETGPSPADPLFWWQMLLDFVLNLIGTLIVAGIVLVVIYLVPDKRVRVVLGVGLVIFLLWQFGFLDLILGAVGV